RSFDDAPAAVPPSALAERRYRIAQDARFRLGRASGHARLSAVTRRRSRMALPRDRDRHARLHLLIRGTAPMSNAYAPVVVTHEEKVRFAVHIGNHRIITAQPLSNGGEDAGPGPLDFLSASLGACVAFYVKQFCAAREIPHDKLRVEVRYHK